MASAESTEDLVAKEFNRIRGEICGLIESWGLPDRQERGAVGTFKSLTYTGEANIKEILDELS